MVTLLSVRLARWRRRSRQEVSGVPSWVRWRVRLRLAAGEGFSKSIVESALDLGISAWMTFWRITFPLILPELGASLMFTFTASFDEFLFGFFLGAIR